MRMLSCLGLALLLGLVLTGCSSGPTDKSAEKDYEVKGKVVAVDTKKPAVTLNHEAIPGLMKAMEMEFKVEDAKLLEGLRPGDQVQGRLKKTDTGYLITRLEKR